MSYPTSRKFPRSMAQAFPREHANPIEIYPEPGYRVVIRVAVFIGAVAVSLYVLGAAL